MWKEERSRERERKKKVQGESYFEKYAKLITLYIVLLAVAYTLQIRNFFFSCLRRNLIYIYKEKEENLFEIKKKVIRDAVIHYI